MNQDSRRATRTQATILQSAELLFTRFGYAKVTMDEIGAESGLKKASLYYYYATKEDLFRAVVERKRAEFRGRVEPLLCPESSALGRIEKYVVIRFEYFKGLQELNILDFKKTTGNAPALMEMFKRHALEELQWLIEIFEFGRLGGEFQVASSERTAEMFLHLLQGLRLRFLRDAKTLRPDDAALRQFRCEMVLFTRIFLAGIQNLSVTQSSRVA
jgi:AcrR family transcriptional regulator